MPQLRYVQNFLALHVLSYWHCELFFCVIVDFLLCLRSLVVHGYFKTSWTADYVLSTGSSQGNTIL